MVRLVVERVVLVRVVLVGCHLERRELDRLVLVRVLLVRFVVERVLLVRLVLERSVVARVVSPARRWAGPAGRVRLVAGVSMAAALALCVLGGWGDVAWWAPLLLATVVAVSEVAVVHLQFGRQRWTFSLTEGALGAAWVASTGAWSVASVVLGVATAQLLRHQPRLKLEFNVAQFALATAAGFAAARGAGGGGARRGR